LFNRTTRSVSLTYAGRIFVAQIKPALEEIQKAMNTVRAQQETPSGTLRINAFATAAREIMAPLVLSYLQRYPQVHIDLVTEGRLVDVVAAGFDLGVRSADLVPSDAIAIPLGQMRRMAVVASLPFSSRVIPGRRRSCSLIPVFACGFPMAPCSDGGLKRTEKNCSSMSRARSPSTRPPWPGSRQPTAPVSAISWKPIYATTL
jgi:DNA-binding transcriptional LysR family regulator